MSLNDSKPYLSVVATSRNDNHGGDLNKRMQIFINGLAVQAMRHRVHCELVLVEWNPPADRPPLKEAFCWPDQTDFCPVRIITVPSNIHSRFKHSDRLPLFQMIAKNVGIRRARGEFILSTNVDLLFSDPLFEFFSKSSLEKNCLYRSDRIDTDRDVPENASLDEQLEYCRSHVLRGNFIDGTFPVPPAPEKRFRLFRTLARYASREFASIGELADEVMYPFRKFPHLHTNTCGDFTLMDRESWFRINGNPELEMYSFHLDTLTMYQAYYAGVRVVNLPAEMAHYHIEHGGGWSPETDRLLYSRMHERKIPIFRMGTVAKYLERMDRGNKIEFSSPEWGLASHSLQETGVDA